MAVPSALLAELAPDRERYAARVAVAAVLVRLAESAALLVVASGSRVGEVMIGIAAGSVDTMTDGRPMRDRVRDALTVAMRERDRVATSAYRTALAALDNAEAVDESLAPPPTPNAQVAGAVAGTYATDVPRRQLSAAEQRAVVLSEIVDRRRLADDFAGAGRPADALRLWAEADLLQGLLGG